MNTSTYCEYNRSQYSDIPMIQRDYVQGADINAEKRDKFLNNIFMSLAGLTDNTGKPYSGKMDFLYGISEGEYTENKTDKNQAQNIENRKRFIPIDGQQRLTTLALIGWLLAQKDKSRKYQMPKLCYRTRHTTEQFCMHLMSYNLPDDYGNIREHLESVPLWMAQRWLTDPSINAMIDLLVTADTMLMSDRFKNRHSEMAEKFFNDSPLTFDQLDMEDYHLTEDLYIKMNARGKHLTEFENWKAEFTGMLEANYPTEKYTFTQVEGTNLTIPEYFSYAIEHEWTDLLWHSAYTEWEALDDENRKECTYPRIDEQFMALLDFFTKALFYSQYPSSAKYSDNPDYKETEKLSNLTNRFAGKANEWLTARRIDIYRPQGESGGVKNIITLFMCLDTLCNITRESKYPNHDNNDIDATDKNDEWTLFFTNLLYCGRWYSTSRKINTFESDNEINLFKRCIENKLTMPLEFLFWGILRYCISYPDRIMTNNLLDYCRILWGWILNNRQRLGAKELNVKPNVRVEDYPALDIVIATLTKDPNAYKALDLLICNNEKQNPDDFTQRAYKELSDEIKRHKVRKSTNPDEIDKLFGCHYLKGDFSNLYPSIENLKNLPGVMMSRFEAFYRLDEWEKTRTLIAHGWKGENDIVDRRYPFYGKDGHWDYIFTSHEKSFREVITSYLCSYNQMLPLPDIKEYYIHRYPSFYNAHRWDEKTSHLFYVENDFYITTLLATFACRVPGYQQCPYAYTVYRKILKDYPEICSKLGLADSPEDGDHGCLRFNKEKYWIECVNQGWRFDFSEGQRWHNKWQTRFKVSENGAWTDMNGVFSFEIGQDNYNLLLDRKGYDRIENCIAFLKALYALI